MTDEFIKHAKAYGKEGELWLEKIPENIAKYEEQWNIKVFPPFKLTYNYVAPAERMDGTKVVIKMGFPKERENQNEIAALEVFNGVGIEMLLEEDKSNGVILIERVIPGIPVTELEEDEATRKIALVIKKLHKPVPENHSFITLSEWTTDLFKVREWFNGTTGPFPEYLIDKAQSLFNDLIASQSTQMLVHGDLHHDNVLLSERDGWLSIDPKGVIAEPCYETAAMLRNPGGRVLKQSNPVEFLKRRIDILSEELGFDPLRIQQWAIAQTVLSGVWSNDENGKGWEESMAIAEALDKIKF
jgi:streptomycin 6-kinase